MPVETNSTKSLGENEIRLFQYDRRGRPITGSLIVYDLSEAPAYSALSYTWAEAYSSEQTTGTDKASSANSSCQRGEPETIIYVDGSPRVITPNLYSALHDLDTCRDLALRHHNNQLDQGSTTVHPIFDALWIDAVCINQDDLEEKSSQVKLMGEIFSQAKAVLIYLGPKHVFLDSFIWCIDDFEPRLEDIPEEQLKLYHGDGILKPQLHHRLGYQEDVQVVRKLTEAIRFLAQCRWFQRTW